MDRKFSLRTSVRLESGCCVLLPLHLDRLAASARALNFNFDKMALEQDLKIFAAGHSQKSPASLRITVAPNGQWTIAPPELLDLTMRANQAVLWPDPVASDDPFLHYSTTYRPIYDHALQDARGRGFVDAVFRNEHGMVTEGANHSVFVRHGALWRTPPLSAGVLPGVYRRHLLATMNNVLEENFVVERLFDADEVWLTNAVRGAQVVTIVPEA